MKGRSLLNSINIFSEIFRHFMLRHSIMKLAVISLGKLRYERVEMLAACARESSSKIWKKEKIEGTIDSLTKSIFDEHIKYEMSRTFL